MEAHLPDTLETSFDNLNTELESQFPIKISCSCHQTDKGVNIREGNRGYFGIIINESMDDFRIVEARCVESSSIDIYERTVGQRTSNDEHVVVVEGTLIQNSADKGQMNYKIEIIEVEKRSVYTET